jgi:hypothetical protein
VEAFSRTERDLVILRGGERAIRPVYPWDAKPACGASFVYDSRLGHRPVGAALFEKIKRYLFRANQLYLHMDCDRIDEDIFDEILLRRQTDPELLEHVRGCEGCSERFSRHQKFIRDLSAALAQAMPLEDDDDFAAGEAPAAHTATSFESGQDWLARPGSAGDS